jgi:hypothetical protein
MKISICANKNKIEINKSNNIINNNELYLFSMNILTTACPKKHKNKALESA